MATAARGRPLPLIMSEPGSLAARGFPARRAARRGAAVTPRPVPESPFRDELDDQVAERGVADVLHDVDHRRVELDRPRDLGLEDFVGAVRPLLQLGRAEHQHHPGGVGVAGARVPRLQPLLEDEVAVPGVEPEVLLRRDLFVRPGGRAAGRASGSPPPSPRRKRGRPPRRERPARRRRRDAPLRRPRARPRLRRRTRPPGRRSRGRPRRRAPRPDAPPPRRCPGPGRRGPPRRTGGGKVTASGPLRGGSRPRRERRAAVLR